MRLNGRIFVSKWTRVLTAFVLFSFLSSAAYGSTPQDNLAQDGPAQTAMFTPSDWTKEPTYLGKISHKLGYGFLNITAGWTALFFEPCRDQNFFVGVGKGIGYMVTNTAGGILHAATFPIPVDIPLPHGGIAYEYKK